MLSKKYCHFLLKFYFIFSFHYQLHFYIFTKLCSVLHESSKNIWSWIKFIMIKIC